MDAMFAFRVGADCISRPVVRPVGSPIEAVNPPSFNRLSTTSQQPKHDS
jgi:hypothetical protein